KLIEFYEYGKVELYNLREDIGETNNLAEKMPEKAQELKEMLHAWLKSVNADMPPRNPDYKP
ncbi:MAG: sulfatase, partial [Gemmatimonadota bacterium]|nr:sulfatase [Gemmatimonadota bacterium]